MILRVSKIIMCFSLSAFAFLVTFSNLTDYDTNFEFVKHVMSMDTTFPGNSLMYRSITRHELWTIAYWMIIFGEALCFFSFFAGGVALWRARKKPAEDFNEAKNMTVIACLIAFLVWFTGFMVIGGEWFAMWQSKTWDGQQAAFRFYTTILLALIFVIQPDRDFMNKKSLDH